MHTHFTLNVPAAAKDKLSAQGKQSAPPGAVDCPSRVEVDCLPQSGPTALEKRVEGLTQQVESLKAANAAEKKRHMEMNSQIIRSNARYQRSLAEAKLKIHEMTQERESLQRKISQQEAIIAQLKEENERLRNVGDD